jgi:DUF1009 family protein
MPLAPDRQPLGIIAGGGQLAVELAHSIAQKAEYQPHIIAISGEAIPEDFKGHPVRELRWGQIGALLSTLQGWQVSKLVFIGSIVARPNLAQLRPDAGALKLLPRLMALARGGDEALFAKIARLFEEQGFNILSPLDFYTSRLQEFSSLNGISPEIEADAALAITAARLCGQVDMGQGAVAVAGRVVAMEGPEGTDKMLDRVKECRRSGRLFRSDKPCGVLVKCARPGQDLRFDIPTIGPVTIEKAHAAGLAGLLVQRHHVMVAEAEKTLQMAQQTGLFVASFQNLEE